MQKDLIMFAATNYEWKQLSYLVNSIKMSGFTGDVCALIFNASFVTVDKLIEKGVFVVGCEKDDEKKMYHHESSMPIHTERFFHFFNILKDNAHRYRYIITVDAKDVIFQKNPSEWLEEHLYKKVVVASEGLKYKDEPWGNENLEKTFGPWFHDYFKHNLIYNVGVIAGEATYMRDLCLSIFLSSVNRPIPIVDQSVFNVMMMTHPWSDVTQFTELRDGWAAHLGTFSDPTKFKEFSPLLVEPPPPKFNVTNGVVVKTSSGTPVTIVHQWDRVPQIRSAIFDLYGDKETHNKKDTEK